MLCDCTMGDHNFEELTPDSESDAAQCLICLNTFSGQPVASPQHCDHIFCLTCITEWAKTKNSCPVDCLKFTILKQKSCNGMEGIEKIITVEAKDELDLEYEEPSICEECGRSSQRHLMLLCSACDSRFHIACLQPPLSARPVEDWFCLECVTEGSHTTNSVSRDESEITETEMMELLSEVVQTSSRLRPSTTTQSAGNVQTRRSERVRRQSGRTHTSLSHTVQHVPRYLLKSNSEDATTSNISLNTQKPDNKKTRKRKKTNTK